MVFGDQTINNASTGLEGLQGLILVLLHLSAVTHDIGG
jgi:hypothetical protein